MFIMLIWCPMDETSSQPADSWELKPLLNYNPVGLAWINFYETLINKSSSLSILKELFRLSKESVMTDNAVWFLGEKAASSYQRIKRTAPLSNFVSEPNQTK